MRRRYDCGILFVHGIGEQRRADTLILAADPLVRWLDTWLSTRPGEAARGEVRLRGTPLSARPHPLDRPAHAFLDIAVNDAHGIPACQKWLLAEAHWAEEVRTPSFSRLAGWLLTTGAWILLSHATRSATAHKGSNWYYLKVAEAILLALLAVPVMQLTIFVLAVLGALPIPRLRALLSDVLLRASGALGDSYVLMESVVQREAIVASTRRSLRWLARRCATVAVVAHSQGAAVAHHVLRDATPANVSVFITYGSGLAKLEEIEVMSQRHSAMLSMAKYGFPLLLLGAAVALRIDFHYSADELAKPALMWCAAPLLMALGIMILAFEDRAGLARRLQALSLRGVRPMLDWFDLYASADPVPNGPLTRAEAPVVGVESRQVSNRGSVVGDHTTYWENGTEFIPAVLERLDHHFKTGLFPQAAVDFPGAATLHGRRVRWLTVARWSSVAAACLFAWAFRERLSSWGGVLFDALKLPVISSVGNFITQPSIGLANVYAGLTGTKYDTVMQYVVGAYGVTVVAAAFALWHRIFRTAWQRWEEAQLRQLLATGHSTNDRGWAAGAIACAALPVVGAVAVMAPPVRNIVVTERLVYQTFGVAMIALYWLFGLAAAGRVTVQFWRRDEQKWAALGGAAFVLAFAIMLTPGLVMPSLSDALTAVAIAGFYIWLLIRWQVGLVARAKELLPGWHRLASISPVVVALGYFVLALAIGTGRSTGGTKGRLIDAMFGTLGLYVIAVGAARGCLWILGRRRRAARAAESPPPVASV
jgi:hypothetical protein